MTEFSYTALDPRGQEIRGSLQAQSRGAALDRISRDGLTAVSVREHVSGAMAPAPAPAPAAGRVSQRSEEAFTRQLANLLAAGVPLSRALHILVREARQPSARARWTAIHDDVIGGMPLADAMSKWPDTFSGVHVAMVRAGEAGGFLDAVLGQIADFRARERDLKSRVLSALVYPAVLAVLAAGVLTLLLTFFIPRFSGIFEEFGGTLPKLTLAVMAVSRALTHYGPVALVAAVLAAALGRRALQTDTGRRALEKVLLRVPAVGTILARFALVRFARMLGTLLGAGVPLVAALKVARQAIGNQTLADAVSGSIERVQRGEALAGSLGAETRLFPPSVTEMIAVAEEGGRLDKELVRLAATYEVELDRRLRMLVTLAEPALLFIMAGVVGTVVIGMLLPVFTLQDFVR